MTGDPSPAQVAANIADPADATDADLIRLSRVAAARFSHSGDDTGPGARADVLSDAALGVARAARDFDPDRGVPFGAYAHFRACNAIRDGLRDRSLLTRRERADGVNYADLPPERRAPVSTDLILESGFDVGTVDPSYTNVEDTDTVTRLLDCLDDRERFVVETTMLADRPLSEVSDALGVSEARVSQLKTRAYRQIRERITAAGGRQEVAA